MSPYGEKIFSSTSVGRTQYPIKRHFLKSVENIRVINLCLLCEQILESSNSCTQDNIRTQLEEKNPASDASHLKARRDEFWFNRFWVGDETIFYLVES